MDVIEKQIYTVKDLKELIKDLPDDMNIYVNGDINDVDLKRSYSKRNIINSIFIYDKEVVLFHEYYDLWCI